MEKLRALKNQVQSEILKQEKSEYFTGFRNEQLRMSSFADMKDFDIAQLTADMIAAHADVSKEVVEQFVPHAVFIYHML